MKQDKINLKKIDENSNESVQDISLLELIPNCIHNVTVSMYEGYHTLFLPTNYDVLAFKVWRNGPGGIFSRDVLNFSRKKEYGNYVLVKTDTQNFIARLIEEEEYEKFKMLKLVDGKIKDQHFMILRHVNDDKLTSYSNFVPTSAIVNDDELEDLYIPVLKNGAGEDEEFEYLGNSVSLFND